MRRPTLAFFLAILVGLIVPGSAPAAVFEVVTTDDSGEGSLREALDRANETQGTDVIKVTAGWPDAILLETALPPISDDVEIVGPGWEWSSLESGVPDSAVLTIEAGVEATLSGIDIRLASRSTDGIHNAGTLELDEVRIKRSGRYRYIGWSADWHPTGRAVENQQDAVLAVRDSLLGDQLLNWDAPGTALHNAGEARIEGSMLTGESRWPGGAIHNTGSVRLAESSVVLARSTRTGGGIYNASGGTVESVNSSIGSNTSSIGGGNIHNASDGGAVVLSNTTVGPGFAPSGASLLADGPVRLRSSIVQHDRFDHPDQRSCAGEGIESAGFNLASDASCFGADSQETDESGMELAWGPYRLNSQWLWSFVTRWGSPAVDRGIADGASIDQLGNARTVDFDDRPNAPGGDGTDIGAFEVQSRPQETSPDWSLPDQANPPSPSAARLSIVKVKRTGSGRARLVARVSAPGRIKLKSTRWTQARARKVDRQMRVGLPIVLKARGRERLRRSARGSRKARLRVRVTLAFTPRGGGRRIERRRAITLVGGARR